MALEWRALDQAATAAGPDARRSCSRSAGALAGPEDYFLRRFAFEFFPRGTGLRRRSPPLAEPEGLPDAAVRAFSIDDHETTEIDDAFSVERLEDGRAAGRRAHRRARALLRPRPSARGRRARAPVDRVLPRRQDHDAARGRGGSWPRSSAGRRVPAASLYLTLDPATLDGRGDRVARWSASRSPTNLRIARARDAPERGSGRRGPRRRARTATTCCSSGSSPEAARGARGAGEEKGDRLDYTIRVADGRVSIEPRRRGTPIDMLVSELMIHVNSTWGKLLAERGYAAIYRNQRGIKTRMEVEPGAHEWLGVSHYAWSSSPLRRFSDLANQRQLVAALRHERARLLARGAHRRRRATSRPPTRRTPSTSARSSATGACATSSRKGSPRPTPPSSATSWCASRACRSFAAPSACRRRLPGDKVRVAFGEPDLWEPSVLCRYAGK